MKDFPEMQNKTHQSHQIKTKQTKKTEAIVLQVVRRNLSFVEICTVNILGKFQPLKKTEQL